MIFDFDKIAPYREKLAAHPIYTALEDLDDLRLFMSHHVYSVWDFMSLIKTLQRILAPTVVPWSPAGDPAVVRFINEIVLEEESDQNAPGADGPAFLSHFELYCRAMEEVGADPAPARIFVTTAARDDIEAALRLNAIPEPASAFVSQTFSFIHSGKSHVVAAAFALGRESIIPAMFRSILKELKILRTDAPGFHYYLERHIHLDEDFHAPMALRTLDALIGNDPVKATEAETAAIEAIRARIAFWDGVMAALSGQRR